LFVIKAARMKKISSLILSFSFFLAAGAGAQDITPNSGFEMWTLKTVPTQYFVPDSWDQLNDETNFIGILTCIQSTDAHSGIFAAKLITKYVDLGVIKDTANGIITTGHLITVPPYGIYGGVPSHVRPDSIFGWIKYEPAAGDSCQIQLDLLSVNNDTVGKALYQTAQTISAYTRFSAPVIYKSTDNPDTIRWMISSSNGYNALPNSTMYVDDIGIVYGTGVYDPPLSDFLTVSPNPAHDVIRIRNDKMVRGTLILYSTAGQRIAYWTLKDSEQEFSVRDLAGGTYLAELVSEHAEILAAGKIVVQ
jgi:hypothetical protein